MQATEPKKKNWASHQKKWYGKWHVWLGLIAGAVIFIVSLTGTILVYRDEIDQALNPEIFEIHKGEKRLSFQQLYDTLKKDHPEIQTWLIIQSDGGPNIPYRVYDKKDQEKEAFINPFTGKLTGSRIHDSHFIGFVLEIHRSLLIPAVGRYIVGIAAIMLVILTISGLRLWIPKQWKHLRSRLTIKTDASSARVNYDLHQVLGLYSSPFVIAIALTGAVITFLTVIAPMMFLLSFQAPKSLDQVLGSKSVYKKGYTRIPIDSVVSIAQRAHPKGEVVGVGIAVDSTEIFAAYITNPYITATGDNVFMYIDQYSGKINFDSGVDLPNTGKMYLNWVEPMHYGTFGGEPTRVIAFVASLIPSILFITGIIVWYPRWKGKKKRILTHEEEESRVSRDEDTPVKQKPVMIRPNVVLKTKEE